MDFIQIFLLAVFTFLSVEGGVKELDEPLSEERADYFFACTDDILCKAKEPFVQRDMTRSLGPEFMKTAMVWYKEINGFDDPEDTDEWWSRFGDRGCSVDVEQRRGWFNEWMTNLGELWMKCCEEDQEDPEGCCVAMAKGEEYFAEVMVEYTEKGVCKTQAQVAAEKMRERQQKEMEMFDGME